MHNALTHHSRYLASILTCCVLGAGSSEALELRTFDADKHLRFLNFPSSPSHNNNFIHSSFDLSGVGWITSDTRRQHAMVSPIHFVGAYHFRPSIGSTLRFLSSDGVIKNSTVTSTINVPNNDGTASDLFIGTINEAITEGDNIAFHPYLNLSSEASYVNQSIIVLGRTVLGGNGTIDTIKDAPATALNDSRVLAFKYSVTSGDDDDCFFEVGDSGSPVFVDQNGVAAIVGTNSLVATLDSGDILNLSNFIPTYVDELNTIMENSGYRMTKAIPGTTNLSLTHTPPTSIIRAGHNLTLQLTLENTGQSPGGGPPTASDDTAENIRLTSTFDNDVNTASTAGTLWFDQSDSASNVASTRRATISNNDTTPLSITFIPENSGLQNYTISHSSDQSSPISQTFSINVIDSFLSSFGDLVDPSPSGDDDQDGIPNLLEYAFGGNPTNSSRQTADGSTPLLPTFSGTAGNNSISYVRRKDFIERAITYQVTSSTDLTNNSFVDATSFITTTNTSSINSELELVTHTLSSSEAKRFFRVEVELNE